MTKQELEDAYRDAIGFHHPDAPFDTASFKKDFKRFKQLIINQNLLKCINILERSMTHSNNTHVYISVKRDSVNLIKNILTVAGAFTIAEDRAIWFRFGEYDHSRGESK